MHISSFKISNYKSFRESREVALEPGFNVIVGKNNSGKTALIEALSLGFDDYPHKSPQTLPSPNSQLPEQSQVDINLTVRGEEIRKVLIDRGSTFNVPRKQGEDPKNALDRFKEFISKERILRAKRAKNIYGSSPEYSDYSSAASVDVDLNKRKFNVNSATSSSNVLSVAARILSSRIYYFDAQRYVRDKNAVGLRSPVRQAKNARRCGRGVVRML